MTSPWLGEFLGTLILILLGDGVVAAVLLKKSKAEGGGWIAITQGGRSRSCAAPLRRLPAEATMRT